MKRTEIYNNKKWVENLIKKISASAISEEQKNGILSFIETCYAEGLKDSTIKNHLCRLRFITTHLKKNFEDVNKGDIISLMKIIESSHYAESEKAGIKSCLRKFYKWLRKTEDYPDEVKWIKFRRNKNKRLPEEILTEQDIEKLINAAESIRDKAFIAIIYESGCRVGEILNLSIKNVSFDKYGATLIVDGKTGQRRIRLISFCSLLATLIENHPFKDNPNSPLWLNISNKNRNAPLSYIGSKWILRNAAQKAGIKKKINPHSFRHARATHLAKYLTEQQLKYVFGWTGSSQMASTYVHLSGKDVDETLLSAYGIKDKEEPSLSLKPKICSRCKTTNSADSDLCKRCGLVLNHETIIDIDEKTRQANELMTALMKDKETRDAIMQGIIRLGLQDKVQSI